MYLDEDRAWVTDKGKTVETSDVYRKVEVRSVDFGRFLDAATAPVSQSHGATVLPFVAAKVDIEGLEYNVLQHLWGGTGRSGGGGGGGGSGGSGGEGGILLHEEHPYRDALCRTKLLAVEWHERMMKKPRGSAAKWTARLGAEPCSVPVLDWD